MSSELLAVLLELSISLSLLNQTLAKEMTIPERIEMHASAYGADPKQLTRVMMCESGGKPEAMNYRDAKITGHPSHGLFQFQPATYKAWAKEIGETRDIMDVDAQIRVAAYAFSKGRQKHWGCWKK